MTDISQYTLDLDCAAGVLPEAVELRLLPLLSRLVDTELEASITAEWEAKLGKHPRMLNGAKFRYGCARVADGGRVCFELALTDYRSMIGTSLSSRLPEIASRGEPRLLANAVGNGAVVETCTKRVGVESESSMHTEAIGSVRCSDRIIVARNVLTALGVPPSGPTLLVTDSKSNMLVANDAGSSARSRHYLRMYRILQQRIACDDIALKYVPDCENAADALTKWVDKGKFERCVAYMTGERSTPR